MGYHLTILRTKDKQSIPIDQKEIESLPSSFPEWQYDAKQIALVSVDERDDAPALWFTDGQLWTTNPSNETITSMIALANKLKARVRGDELETYRSANETYIHPDDAEKKTEADEDEDIEAWRRREQLKLWAIRAAFIGGAALLGFLLKKFGVTK